mmetsp:Transcript_76356/g.181576  ORF Transcript_76356/g.181576 Transcript_76356/m.181576 type:complete len:238 (-) Transcript_76356:26-739(-)
MFWDCRTDLCNVCDKEKTAEPTMVESYQFSHGGSNGGNDDKDNPSEHGDDALLDEPVLERAIPSAASIVGAEAKQADVLPALPLTSDSSGLIRAEIAVQTEHTSPFVGDLDSVHVEDEEIQPGMFRVKLPPSSRLGLQLRHEDDDDKSITILKVVAGGSVAAWNDSMPDSAQVEAGDAVVEINSVSTSELSVPKAREMLRGHEPVRLLLRKPAAFSSNCAGEVSVQKDKAPEPKMQS